MKVTICVSPEAGWSELEDFLAGTQQRLTMACISSPRRTFSRRSAARSAPAGPQFELVLHPDPRAAGEERRQGQRPPRGGGGHRSRSQKQLKDRFRLSWATLKSKTRPDGLWASAYHIKVAVRDGKAFWLSSGNWQSSNQPNVHLFAGQPDKLPAGFQRKYNRE